jgi:hypothetical protein
MGCPLRRTGTVGATLPSNLFSQTGQARAWQQLAKPMNGVDGHLRKYLELRLNFRCADAPRAKIARLGPLRLPASCRSTPGHTSRYPRCSYDAV